MSTTYERWRPYTDAERQARRRAVKSEREAMVMDALQRIQRAATCKEAQRIATATIAELTAKRRRD